MALGTAGLYTHIRNNNFKSLMLLGFYPIILLALTWIIAALFGATVLTPSQIQPYAGWGKPQPPPPPTSTDVALETANNFLWSYWPAILTIIVIWFAVSYFAHTRMISGMAHARRVTRDEEPEIYNLLENLCISQGMTMPRLEIIETHARNAFASGINEKSYTVTVTRGLLRSLSRDEVEAVLAHELTHIVNRDVRLLMVTIVFTGMVGLAAQMAWSYLRFGLYMPRSGGRRDGRVMLFILGVMAILGIGYLATLVTRFALSRRREYMADAGAVEMTKNPEAMMRALLRISGRDRIKAAPDDIAQMCVENTKPFLGYFSTHPPIEKRVKAISGLSSTPVPSVGNHQPAPRGERFEPPGTPHENWVSRQRREDGKTPNPWHRKGDNV